MSSVENEELERRAENHYQAAREAVNRMIGEVYHLRNAYALARFVRLARELVDDVESFRQDPLTSSAIKDIASRNTDWPCLVGVHPAAVDNLQAALLSLGLASSHPQRGMFGFSDGVKRARADSPAQKISIDIKDTILRMRRSADAKKAGRDKASLTNTEDTALSLDVLSAENFPAWFALGWETWVADNVVIYKNAEQITSPSGKELAGSRGQVKESPVTYVKKRVKASSRWWVAR